ncbi:MAG: hypothetical protein R2724_23595 [Bryobacterales bacterium]
MWKAVSDDPLDLHRLDESFGLGLQLTLGLAIKRRALVADLVHHLWLEGEAAAAGVNRPFRAAQFDFVFAFGLRAVGVVLVEADNGAAGSTPK